MDTVPVTQNLISIINILSISTVCLSTVLLSSTPCIDAFTCMQKQMPGPSIKTCRVMSRSRRGSSYSHNRGRDPHARTGLISWGYPSTSDQAADQTNARTSNGGIRISRSPPCAVRPPRCKGGIWMVAAVASICTRSPRSQLQHLMLTC